VISYPTRHEGLQGSGDTAPRIPNLVIGWAECSALWSFALRLGTTEQNSKWTPQPA